MKIFKGKQIKGKTSYLPHIFIWGGTLFINVLRTSYMIPIHQEILNFIEFLGFDPYDG